MTGNEPSGSRGSLMVKGLGAIDRGRQFGESEGTLTRFRAETAEGLRRREEVRLVDARVC